MSAKWRLFMLVLVLKQRVKFRSAFARWLTFGCVKRPKLTRVLSKLFRFRIRARKLVLENWYVWPE